MKAILTWEQFMRYVLEVLANGQTLSLHDLKEQTLNKANISATNRLQLLSSGQPIAENRIAWAASYLNRVDALNRPQRGQYQITSIGRNLLAQHPNGISEKDLRPLAKSDDKWWVKAQTTGTLALGGSLTIDATDSGINTSLDPTEQIEHGIDQINRRVSADLISRLQDKNPAFFEQAVVDLLLAMGYGGAHGRGEVTQLTNDKGIDGIIDQDALGLRKVYIQAKRYSGSNSVQRPEVQRFVGALSGKADGGLFITTGSFSTGAKEYAQEVPARVILIDGQQLAQLMIKYGVGVETEETLHIVRLDEDYFA